MENKLPTIIIDNVECRLQGVPINVANVISKRLSVQAPNFWFSEKYKNGQWDGRIKFFKRPANIFPTGLIDKVVTILEKEFNISVKLVDKRLNIEDYKLIPIDQDYKISDVKVARDYQVDAVNKLITKSIHDVDFTRGIVNIATNGGKTSIAIAFIKELYPKLLEHGTNFLFVTHSKEIARQAQKSIQADLGIEVGFIGDGKWDLKPISVAIVTTLYKRLKKPEFKHLVENVVGFVADECHHSSANSWYEVFNSLKNASIRIGLTGTVDKANPVNEMKLYSCTGSIISKVSNDYLIENGYSAKPICIMFEVHSPELGDASYQDAYDLGIVESQERLDIITQICDKETSSHNTVLILVERVEHGDIIKQELEHINKNVYFTNGQLDSDTRQQLLDDLKAGKIDVLISTAILDEGVDVSNINAVIYARGGKSTRKLLQGLGRGLRKKSDGSKLRFYDFIDDTHEALLMHSSTRYEILKAEQFTIKLLTISKYKTMTWKEIENV